MALFICFMLCILFTFILVSALQGSKRRSGSKLPPGPSPWPIIGNILEIGDKPHKSLAELSKIHGPLMSLKIGRVTTVVISSANIAKEVLRNQELSDRTVTDSLTACDHHKVGLPWLPASELWRNLRKICNTYLFTPQKLDANQDLRRKRVEELLAMVQESCRLGSAVDIFQAALWTTFSSLASVVFSLDLKNSSSEAVQEFQEVVKCVIHEVGKPNLSDSFPMLKKIDPQGTRHRMEIHFRKLLEFFDHIIQERLELRKTERYIPFNDMLDTLLTIGEDKMDINCIKHFFVDLFVAGTETTSGALEWAMAELLRNPECLSKARAELDQNIGRGSLVGESDIDRLPYLQAIIKETFRLRPVGPMLLPRKARSDVELCGFRVPKDAQVLINVWAIGRDPSIWEDPNSFVPERFLGSEIDLKGRNYELIPFGAGRRICPGLPLATRQLPVILGSLINCFDWRLEDGVTPETMDMEDRHGLILQKAKPLRAVPMQV